MWDLLLSSEQEAKLLTGSILSPSSLRLQTEYMGIRKTKITVHGVSVDICGDRMGAFFRKYRQVDEMSALRRKTGITTGDIVLHLVSTRQFSGHHKCFEMPGKRMLVVYKVGGSVVGAMRHMAKACPGKKVEQPTKNTPSTAAVVV